MAQSLPITIRQHVQLQDVGVNAASIGFNTVTMESDKFICVREKVAEASQVAIIDLASPQSESVVRRPITADSALMNPESKVIALKAGRQLQVFDFDAKAKVVSHQMNEDVVFWKWTDRNNLGVVTDKAVYHWSIETKKAPVKVFDRSPRMGGCQIINYRVNPTENWMALVGISQQDNRVVGTIQLFSKDKSATQIIEGHAAAFAEINLDGSSIPTRVFAFASRGATAAKLHIAEIDHQEGAPAFTKKNVDVFFPPEAMGDFPVSMQISQRYGIIFLVTKFGFIHMYDLESGITLLTDRISQETIFVTADFRGGSGIIGVNRQGSVLSTAVDEQKIVSYLLARNNVDVALRLASRANLPGAEDLYVTMFQRHVQQGNYTEAAKVAATSPCGILRTPKTIEDLKHLPVQSGQLSPILQYFSILLEKGDLNKHESIELAKPVLAQNRKQLLEKWLKGDKLECSEDLGDIVKQHDATLALSVYLRANVPSKVVQCFAETGQFDKIVLYANKVGFKPEYHSLLSQLLLVNPDKGAELATMLVNAEDGPLLPINQIIDLFMRHNLVQAATAFLLDALKDNKPEHASLQTRLIEMNLLNAPQVADAILGNEMFTHYDRPYTAQLCERAGLTQRALEHFTEFEDIKRNVVQTQNLSPEWLLDYFGRLSVDQTLACLREMLAANIRQNLQIVVQVATKYSEFLQPANLIELFESFQTNEGLYYYLGAIVNTSQDPLVHLSYIQAACRAGQTKEAERICRESSVYDAEKVKNFLKEARLTDQTPLMIVCDRFDFVSELVMHLHQNNEMSAIETYVQLINPSRLPLVVGTLLDLDCDEGFIKKLLNITQAPFDVAQLVAEVEKRNRLKVLQNWLEKRVEGGSDDVAVYNAIAKIYIDLNVDPERFLKTNKKYDPSVVGQYCAKRDPGLAFIAFERGKCDEQIIALAMENAMFKQLSRYLVKRRDLSVWQRALDPSNDNRKSFIDQVTAVALPESSDPEEVSIAVKAFMTADLPHELIELLEKIIFENSLFSENKNLQNLLIMTAIKADPNRVQDYIVRLNNFDALDIANIAVINGLYEEALMLYKKQGANEKAVSVLLDNINDVNRGVAFAESTNEPAVWSKLAQRQLSDQRVKDSIDSYIRAEDAANYKAVVEAATQAEKYDDLMRYLSMARKKVREPYVDSELLYAYAQCNRYSDIESFLASPNLAQIEAIGDRCFEHKLLDSAKIFYSSVSNWGKLATTLIQLQEYEAAIDCARKANSIKIWKQVNDTCFANNEFKLAQICGLNLVIHAEELESIVRMYKSSGHIAELVSLLTASLGLERAHMGIFTELAIIYAKHQPDNLMEHLRLHWSRLNIPKTIRACENSHLWNEAIFLYTHYDEFDNAAKRMMEHAGEAWTHKGFKEIVVKAANLEVYYKAIDFYLEQHPDLLIDLLTALTPRIDHARVARSFVKAQRVPLIRPYLVAVQSTNTRAVNEAYNDLLIAEEDFKGLRASIDQYDNFDNIALAQRLEKHELIEFRRIASHIYKKNRRWKQSMTLSKEDKLYPDAMRTAHESQSVDIAEDLLRFFVEQGEKECFASCLYTCYDLIRADVALELAWRHGWMDFAMPFMVQTLRESMTKIDTLEKEVATLKAKQSAMESQAGVGSPNTPGLGNTLMITAGPGPHVPPLARSTSSSGVGFGSGPNGTPTSR